MTLEGGSGSDTLQCGQLEDGEMWSLLALLHFITYCLSVESKLVSAGGLGLTRLDCIEKDLV